MHDSAEVRHGAGGGTADPESYEVQLRLGALAVACLGAQSRGVVCGLRLDAFSVESWHDTRAGEHHIARISLRSPTALDALDEAIVRFTLLDR